MDEKNSLKEIKNALLGLVSADESTGGDDFEIIMATIAQLKEKQESVLQSTDLKQRLNEFTYIVSHDLKAPIRGIHNLAELLKEDLEDHQDEEVRENIGLIIDRSSRLLKMIENLLEYSRIATREKVFQKLRVEGLISEILQLNDPENRIKLLIPEPMPEIEFDRRLLYKLLLELTLNVLHHSDEEVTLKVTSTVDENFITFCFEDNGPGINEEHLEKVFEIFQTLQPKHLSKGLGVGLAFAKKIVEDRGGKIWIAPGSEIGTRIFFTIPK